MNAERGHVSRQRELSMAKNLQHRQGTEDTKCSEQEPADKGPTDLVPKCG
jgi:hypothetical protein